MTTSTKIGWRADVCDCCGQTKTYLLPVDRGAVVILKKVAAAVGRKGINCIHLAKEKVLTHSELCNIVRPRFHGLVAHVDGEGMKGNFCLTRKGMDFLKGARIPRYAIVSKVKSRQVGYFDPENLTCVLGDYRAPGEAYWEGIGYEIEGGRVVRPSDLPENKQEKLL